MDFNCGDAKYKEKIDPSLGKHDDDDDDYDDAVWFFLLDVHAFTMLILCL